MAVLVYYVDNQSFERPILKHHPGGVLIAEYFKKSEVAGHIWVFRLKTERQTNQFGQKEGEKLRPY
jgi:hypothetical protein